MSRLEVLDLRLNPIGHDGLVAIRESPHMRNLRSFAFSAPGPKGIGALAAARFPLLTRPVMPGLDEGGRSVLCDMYGEHAIVS
jgi:hypothetical protein